MRINLVHPTELYDQHLIAEYREIRLLSACLQRTLKSKCGFQQSKVPLRYTLNKGHGYFFFNKGKYLHKRYNLLMKEMRRRNMNPICEFPIDKWPKFLYNDWEPKKEDFVIIRQRIKEKIQMKPNWYRMTKEIK